MTQPAAFRGTYSDWRLVKTRAVVQVIFEVPLADSDAAYEVLGGMPVHGNERWFGIAAIKTGKEAMQNSGLVSPNDTARPQPSQPQAGAKRDWRAVPFSQQAGIRINEATFAAYLREEHSDEWHETGDADACVKLICFINRKRDLATNHKSALMWHQLDTQYQAWLARERVGA